MISGIAHVNLLVPPGTLDQANAFYGETLGLSAREVPSLQKGSLAWYVQKASRNSSRCKADRKFY